MALHRRCFEPLLPRYVLPPAWGTTIFCKDVFRSSRGGVCLQPDMGALFSTYPSIVPQLPLYCAGAEPCAYEYDSNHLDIIAACDTYLLHYQFLHHVMAHPFCRVAALDA